MQKKIKEKLQTKRIKRISWLKNNVAAYFFVFSRDLCFKIVILEDNRTNEKESGVVCLIDGYSRGKPLVPQQQVSGKSQPKKKEAKKVRIIRIMTIPSTYRIKRFKLNLKIYSTGENNVFFFQNLFFFFNFVDFV